MNVKWCDGLRPAETLFMQPRFHPRIAGRYASRNRLSAFHGSHIDPSVHFEIPVLYNAAKVIIGLVRAGYSRPHSTHRMIGKDFDPTQSHRPGKPDGRFDAMSPAASACRAATDASFVTLIYDFEGKEQCLNRRHSAQRGFPARQIRRPC